MPDIETVSEGIRDPLYAKQKEGVAKMRAALLACTDESGTSIRYAVQAVTAMRIYHQLSRIIRYTEMMDKLEEKLYEQIDSTLDNTTPGDVGGMAILLGLQEKLQKNMIESHQLLKPYLEVKTLGLFEVSAIEEDSTVSNVLNSNSRDRLRLAAQSIMKELDTEGSSDE